MDHWMKYLSGWKLLGLLIEPGWKIGVFLARLLARMITGVVSLGGDPSAIQFAKCGGADFGRRIAAVDGRRGWPNDRC
eukprot:3118207-Prymnesium_polylepis.1